MRNPTVSVAGEIVLDLDLQKLSVLFKDVPVEERHQLLWIIEAELIELIELFDGFVAADPAKRKRFKHKLKGFSTQFCLPKCASLAQARMDEDPRKEQSRILEALHQANRALSGAREHI